MEPDDRNERLVQQPDLEKLPIRTLAKSMRPLEDIMASYIAKGELKPDEERLLDRVMFEKTGQHIGRFKDRKPPEEDELVLGIEGSADKQKAKEVSESKRKPSKAPESVS